MPAIKIGKETQPAYRKEVWLWDTKMQAWEYKQKRGAFF